MTIAVLAVIFAVDRAHSARKAWTEAPDGSHEQPRRRSGARRSDVLTVALVTLVLCAGLAYAVFGLSVTSDPLALGGAFIVLFLTALAATVVALTGFVAPHVWRAWCDTFRGPGGFPPEP